MSRDNNGDYTLPTGNPVVSGTIIDADNWANPTLADVAESLTDSLSRSGKGAMLAALQLVAGSLASPGLQFTEDTDTGIRLAAAGDMRLTVGGEDVIGLTSTLISLLKPFAISEDLTLLNDKFLYFAADDNTITSNGAWRMSNNPSETFTIEQRTGGSFTPVISMVGTELTISSNVNATADLRISNNSRVLFRDPSGTANPDNLGVFRLFNSTSGNLTLQISDGSGNYKNVTEVRDSEGGLIRVSEGLLVNRDSAIYMPSDVNNSASGSVAGVFRLLTLAAGAWRVQRSVANVFQDVITVSQAVDQAPQVGGNISDFGAATSILSRAVIESIINDAVSFGSSGTDYYVRIGLEKTGVSRMAFIWGSLPPSVGLQTKTLPISLNNFNESAVFITPGAAAVGNAPNASLTANDEFDYDTNNYGCTYLVVGRVITP